jgi:hypothetical protein
MTLLPVFDGEAAARSKKKSTTDEEVSRFGKTFLPSHG